MIRFYRIVSSLQVGIGLLVLLTILSLVGVIIPQGLLAERYLHQWGTVGGGALLGAGLDHLFSTLWYNILLGLFASNVLLCTDKRLKRTVFAMFETRFLSVPRIGALANHAAIEDIADGNAAVAQARSFFRKRGFSVAEGRCGDERSLDIRKGRMKEFGSALLHVSLLPLLVGGLVGRMGGFSYTQQLSGGESAPVRERSFFVRCDYFSLERNEHGQVKDYKSGLTLLDSAGDTLARKVIEVNSPLVYRGIKFYQSSYRGDPSLVDKIEMVLTGPLLGDIGKKVVLRPGVADTIGGGGGVVATAEDFMPDFMFDRETKSAVNRSDNPNNPAVFVTLLHGSDTLLARWVFKNFSSMHHTGDSYGASFLSYDSPMSTGLLIKENPGGGVIWFGILGMSLGIMLVFWIPRRRYWVALRSGNGGAEVHVGSMVQRDDAEGADRFEETMQALRAVLKNEQETTGAGNHDVNG